MSADLVFMTQYFAINVKNNWKKKGRQERAKIRPMHFISKLLSPREGKSGFCWEKPNLASQRQRWALKEEGCSEGKEGSICYILESLIWYG